MLQRSLDPSQVTAMARLFSASVVQEMARWGQSVLFARLALESSLLDHFKPSERVRTLFDGAYNLLKKAAYRHEYVYKTALTHKVLLGRHSLRSAAMLTEFRVGECRADVAILNGTSTAYEVKSERDKLDRLEAQVAAYMQVFAQVNVITGENHLGAVCSLVPPEVGVLRLSDRYQISTIREAADVPGRIKPEAVFDSLRTSESKRILRLHGIACPDVPNTRLRAALGEHFVKLTPHQAHTGMVQVLRQTRSMLPLAQLVEALPNSVQAAALSTRLRRGDYPRLLEAMNTPLSNALNWS